MAGHALAVADAFPKAEIVGIEPAGADDFCQSLDVATVRMSDLQVSAMGCVPDVGNTIGQFYSAMCHRRWLCPIRTRRRPCAGLSAARSALRPSGAIAVAAVLTGRVRVEGEGDIALVVSRRNRRKTV